MFSCQLVSCLALKNVHRAERARQRERGNTKSRAWVKMTESCLGTTRDQTTDSHHPSPAIISFIKINDKLFTLSEQYTSIPSSSKHIAFIVTKMLRTLRAEVMTASVVVSDVWCWALVPGHCGRLQLYKGSGCPRPGPLLGLLQPITILARHNSHQDLDIYIIHLFDICVWGVVRGSNAAFLVIQGANLLSKQNVLCECWANRATWNSFGPGTADTGSVGGAPGGQNLN